MTHLTPREHETLKLVAKLIRNGEAAKNCNIAPVLGVHSDTAQGFLRHLGMKGCVVREGHSYKLTKLGKRISCA